MNQAVENKHVLEGLRYDIGLMATKLESLENYVMQIDDMDAVTYQEYRKTLRQVKIFKSLLVARKEAEA